MNGSDKKNKKTPYLWEISFDQDVKRNDATLTFADRTEYTLLYPRMYLLSDVRLNAGILDQKSLQKRHIALSH